MMYFAVHDGAFCWRENHVRSNSPMLLEIQAVQRFNCIPHPQSLPVFSLAGDNPIAVFMTNSIRVCVVYNRFSPAVSWTGGGDSSNTD